MEHVGPEPGSRRPVESVLDELLQAVELPLDAHRHSSRPPIVRRKFANLRWRLHRAGVGRVLFQVVVAVVTGSAVGVGIAVALRGL